MKVRGVEISQDILDKAAMWFPPDRSFDFNSLTSALIKLGVPWGDADRVADRLLKQWRKQGTHAYSGGKWKRVV